MGWINYSFWIFQLLILDVDSLIGPVCSDVEGLNMECVLCVFCIVNLSYCRAIFNVLFLFVGGWFFFKDFAYMYVYVFAVCTVSMV